MNYVEAAALLRPGSSWLGHGDSYEGLKQAEPEDPTVTIPTKAELDAVIAANSYISKRTAAYPTIGDQLDAIMKGGQSLADMQAACMAVKTKYPKGA